MDDSERTAQGAEIVSETIAEKVITTAMESLRREFTEVIEKVTAVLKEQFSKELTNALDVIYARLDTVEGRVTGTAMEQNSADISVSFEGIRKELQDAMRIANDTEQYVRRYHRLRGSASTVLTATSQVNERWRILTPHRIETHEPTATKFRTIDYVRGRTP